MILAHKSLILGFTTKKGTDMPKAEKPKQDRIYMEIRQQYPDVFGEYGGILGVTIGLEFSGDAANFETEIDVMQARMVKKIRTAAKEIALQAGVKIPAME